MQVLDQPTVHMISIKYLSMYLSSTYQIIKYFNDTCMRCINWSCVLIICSEFILLGRMSYERTYHFWRIVGDFTVKCCQSSEPTKMAFYISLHECYPSNLTLFFFPKYINRDILSRQWVKHLSKCNEKLDDTRPWLYGYHIHWFFLCLIFVSIYLSKTFHTTSHRNLTSVALPL